MTGVHDDSLLNSGIRQLDTGLLDNLRLHWRYPLNSIFIEMVQLNNDGKFDAAMLLTLNIEVLKEMI